MGGAAGHMSHPFDLPTVGNGSDLFKFFQDAAELLTTGPGSVKIDGVNVSFKLIDGPSGKEFAVDRGSLKPIDVEGITADRIGERFPEGHGMRPAIAELLAIFNTALPSITPELKELGLYDNPSVFFNTEYVKGTTNVLQYDEDFLAIHGVNQFYEKTSKLKGKAQRPGAERPISPVTDKPIKDPSREVPYDQSVLSSLIQKVNPIAEKYGFKIYGDVPTEVVEQIDFGPTLATNFTVVFSEEDEVTKPLGQWLATADNPKGVRIELVDGRTMDALSKHVYISILNGVPLTQLVKNGDDAKVATDAAVFYHATRVLGNDVMNALTSPMGDIEQHEGVIVRNPMFGAKPVKITGEFIVKGLETSFPRGNLAEQLEMDSTETVGLVPMAAKPYHAGHHALITIASQQNDKVIVFVSTSDRKRTGQFPIYGEDMERIWKEEIERILPSNVVPIYGGSPVRNVYEILGQANEEGGDTKYVIYSDPEDTEINYPVCNRLKYFPELYEAGLVMCAAEISPDTFTRGVGTPDVSGTKLRAALENNDFETFAAGLPAGVDTEKVFRILRREEAIEEQKKTLSLLFSLVESTLNEKKKKKTDCFKKGRYKTFKGKSKCIQRTKGLSKERADAYVASVLRDMGELDEAASMAGGAIAGYAGVAPDAKRDDKKKKINGLIREEDLVEDIINYLLEM